MCLPTAMVGGRMASRVPIFNAKVRARSPLRAALGCADLTFRFESVSAPLRARLRRAPLQGAVRAVCSRVRLYLNRLLRARATPNFARRGSRQSIEPKAVLEHRAPKLLLQSFTVETQRIGRARSPLRVGLGHANPTCRFESCFSAPLRARLRAGNLLVREKTPC